MAGTWQGSAWAATVTPQEAATALFRERYGEAALAEAVTVFAPGRVNLIGEHTDYNGGHVMPLALKFRTVIVGRRTPGSANSCKIASARMLEGAVASFNGDGGLKPEPQSSSTRWTNYVKGVIAQYVADCGGAIGLELAVASDVPMGSGLSSSAALEVATANLIETVYGVHAGAATGAKPGSMAAKIARALRCQKCEHEFCYTNCGIMDQFISSVGQRGHALLIDCRSCHPTLVPLNDPNVSLVVANTLATHALGGDEGDSWYNLRVAACSAAVAAMRKRAGMPDDAKSSFASPDDGTCAALTLRDFSAEALEAVKAELTAVQYNRAKHAIEENDRCIAAQNALSNGDYKTVGELMNASHESLRDLYEVSCEELDALQAAALNEDGVFGSRMTGAGYGGCTVTLVRTDKADALRSRLMKEYYVPRGLQDRAAAAVFVTTADAGAGVLPTAGAGGGPAGAAVRFGLAVLCMMGAKMLA